MEASRQMKPALSSLCLQAEGTWKEQRYLAERLTCGHICRSNQYKCLRAEQSVLGGSWRALPLARCPPQGLSWGAPACLFTLHLFRSAAPVPFGCQVQHALAG